MIQHGNSAEISDESDLPALAKKILSDAGERKVFLFYGEMGSGKTTLIKALCQALGASEGLGSPTYSIVNEYHANDGKILYHFDLYRIKDLAECLDLGMEDYLYSGNYCFIEWPEIAERIYPEELVEVSIARRNSKREFSWKMS